MQSGYYSYVIDEKGDFYVKRGNTTSHSAMIEGRPAIAAGMFRVNRIGRVVEVACGCTDYAFDYDNPRHPLKSYVIQSFANHHGFNLNPGAVFRFRKGIMKAEIQEASGRPLTDLEAQSLLALMDQEGAGDAISVQAGDDQPTTLAEYHPSPPPRLYAMQLDHLVTSIEQGDQDDFDYGGFAPRFGFTGEPIRSGKNNFIIDQEGWLIVGLMGHQLLSGGQVVGGAGHLVFEPSGEVSAIELNFSGHYRPDLTSDYVRYAYGCIKSHPLITIGGNCRYAGRKFKDCEVVSTVIAFTQAELESDDDRIDLYLETDFDDVGTMHNSLPVADQTSTSAGAPCAFFFFDPMYTMRQLLQTLPSRWQRTKRAVPRSSGAVVDGCGLCSSCNEFVHVTCWGTSGNAICPSCGHLIGPSNPLRALGSENEAQSE